MKTVSKRLVIEVVLFIFVVLGFCYDVTGTYWHEIIGIGVVALVYFHHIYNFRWYLALKKGRYLRPRMLTTAVNIGLATSFVLMLLSGVMNSYLIEDYLGVEWQWNTRDIHVFGAYWFLLFLAGHIGLHWSMMTSMLKVFFQLKSKSKTKISMKSWCLRFMVWVWGGYGFFIFIHQNIIEKLTFQQSYDFIDESAPISYFFDLISLFVFLSLVMIEINKRVRTH